MAKSSTEDEVTAVAAAVLEVVDASMKEPVATAMESHDKIEGSTADGTQAQDAVAGAVKLGEDSKRVLRHSFDRLVLRIIIH